jgi:hypothetical protein
LEEHRQAQRNGSPNKYSLSAPTVEERGQFPSYSGPQTSLNVSIISQRRRESESPQPKHIFPPNNAYMSPEQPTGCAVNADTRPPLPQNHHRKASGLDNLAFAALTSPPSVTGTPSPDRQYRDTAALGATPISFPSFPHDIFNGGTQTSAASKISIEDPIGTSNTKRKDIPAAAVRFEGEGLPPKELLNILFDHSSPISDRRIDIFFEYIHPSIPILHKTSFLSSLLLPHSSRPQSTIILRAIVACTAKYAQIDSRLKVSHLSACVI